MRITRLTKQFRGHQHFKYCVNFTYKDFQLFVSQREWCWSTWGPSTELEFYSRTKTSNTHWAWICDQHRIRIYLSQDSDASHYALKWSDR